MHADGPRACCPLSRRISAYAVPPISILITQHGDLFLLGTNSLETIVQRRLSMGVLEY